MKKLFIAVMFVLGTLSLGNPASAEHECDDLAFGLQVLLPPWGAKLGTNWELTLDLKLTNFGPSGVYSYYVQLYTPINVDGCAEWQRVDTFEGRADYFEYKETLWDTYKWSTSTPGLYVAHVSIYSEACDWATVVNTWECGSGTSMYVAPDECKICGAHNPGIGDFCSQ